MTIQEECNKIYEEGYKLCDELNDFREKAWEINRRACARMEPYIGKYYKAKSQYCSIHGSTQQYLKYFKILAKPETMYYGKPEHKTYHFSNTPAYCVFDYGYPRRCGIDMEIFHPLGKGPEEFEKRYEEVSQEEFLTAVREAIIQTDAWEYSERMKANGNR